MLAVVAALSGCAASTSTSTTTVSSAPVTTITPAATITTTPANLPGRSTAGVPAVARRFAGAYLRYQIGENTPGVQRELTETCTPKFARFLLTSPARVPTGRKHDPAFSRAVIDNVDYHPSTGLQIVNVDYHPVHTQRRAHRRVRGAVQVQVVSTPAGWRVIGLG